MGAWGVLVFENDDANEWAYGLEEIGDLSLIEAALDAVEQSPGTVEAPEGAIALGACEVLAWLNGRPGTPCTFTEKIGQWVDGHNLTASPQLLDRGVHVVDRILSEESELRQLWAETEFSEQWLECVRDLRSRLQTAAATEMAS